jgi:hypothetical protein
MNRQSHLALRWGLRPLGATLLLAAGAAGEHVLALTSGRADDPPALAYLTALGALLCFSTGCALLLHGRHLFDTVEIADRWKHATVAPEKPFPDE